MSEGAAPDRKWVSRSAARQNASATPSTCKTLAENCLNGAIDCIRFRLSQYFRLGKHHSCRFGLSGAAFGALLQGANPDGPTSVGFGAELAAAMARDCRETSEWIGARMI